MSGGADLVRLAGKIDRDPASLERPPDWLLDLMARRRARLIAEIRDLDSVLVRAGRQKHYTFAKRQD